MQQKEGALESRLEFDVSQEQKIAHGRPNLGEHGILGGAQEGFDFEMLLDPFPRSSLA